VFECTKITQQITLIFFGITQFLRCQMNKLTMKLHADSLVITVIYPARLKYNLIFAYFHIVYKIISTV